MFDFSAPWVQYSDFFKLQSILEKEETRGRTVSEDCVVT